LNKIVASYPTRSANKETIHKKWVLIDAKNAFLGRVASRIAHYLIGKHKRNFTTHINTGDHVIVINSAQVRLSGKKLDKKEYRTYTGYPGGQRVHTARQIKDKSPVRLMELAVKRMLPKNILGREMFRHLHVYEGTNHPHVSQKPAVVS